MMCISVVTLIREEDYVPLFVPSHRRAQLSPPLWLIIATIRLLSLSFVWRQRDRTENGVFLRFKLTIYTYLFIIPPGYCFILNWRGKVRFLSSGCATIKETKRVFQGRFRQFARELRVFGPRAIGVNFLQYAIKADGGYLISGKRQLTRSEYKSLKGETEAIFRNHIAHNGKSILIKA